MHHSDFAVLYDPVTELTCHRVPVDGTTRGLVEPVRGLFVACMSNFGYVGFSYEIDDVFHRRSSYIYITDSAGNVIMTCRATRRDSGTVVPFETGLREDGRSYHLSDAPRVVEINTYTYVRGHYDHAMPLLVAGLGQHCKANAAEGAYFLYDVGNDRIRRSYLAVGFTLSERFPEPVHFNSFGRSIGGRLVPTRWRILEWSQETIEGHDRAARERYWSVG